VDRINLLQDLGGLLGTRCLSSDSMKGETIDLPRTVLHADS
jgi:hypothetical protein